MNIKTLLIIILSTLLLSSCNSYKKMSYLKDVETLTPEQLATINAGLPKIMPGDLLTIYVNTVNPTASVPFNLPLVPMQGSGLGGISSTMGTQSYLVDDKGYIDYPVLGKQRLAGKTREEVEAMLKQQIYPKYITEEPIISVRFASFRISILGEVNRPGMQYFSSDRVNIFEALAMAGDLTIYGKRENVLLMRENLDGSMQYIRFNLQDKNLVLSPYFNLKQNDILYIEPNKAKGNSSSIGATENLTISVVSVLISVATLLITVFK